MCIRTNLEIILESVNVINSNICVLFVDIVNAHIRVNTFTVNIDILNGKIAKLTSISRSNSQPSKCSPVGWILKDRCYLMLQASQ